MILTPPAKSSPSLIFPIPNLEVLPLSSFFSSDFFSSALLSFALSDSLPDSACELSVFALVSPADELSSALVLSPLDALFLLSPAAEDSALVIAVSSAVCVTLVTLLCFPLCKTLKARKPKNAKTTNVIKREVKPFCLLSFIIFSYFTQLTLLLSLLHIQFSFFEVRNRYHKYL